MKARMKFTKTGEMRFIGHLDLMRHFQKALRRSGLPIKFSEGMSPHMIMSFASPLGLGLTSEGEYVDIEFRETIPSAVIIEAMNRCLVDEVRILSCKVVADGHATNAMSLVAAADYTVHLREEYVNRVFADPDSSMSLDTWTSRIDDFMEQPSISVMKETKKGTKEVDIRPMIYSMKSTESGGIFLSLSAGSAANLKPELVMNAYASFIGITIPEYAMAVHRMEMYAVGKGDQQWVSLDDLGEVIPGEGRGYDADISC